MARWFHISGWPDRPFSGLDSFATRGRYKWRVKVFRPLIAALMLLAWLQASAHLALEHGGDGFGSQLANVLHVGHAHEPEPAPGDDDHHHHNLGALTRAPFGKSCAQQLLAPLWVPLYDCLLAELAAALRETDAAHQHSTAGDSPPDQRASGWLLVVRTALPVRGPSSIA